MNQSRTQSDTTAGALGVATAVLLLAGPMVPGQLGIALWLGGFLLLIPFVAIVADLAPVSRRLGAVAVAGAAMAATLQLTVAGMAHVSNTLDKASPVHEPMHSVESTLLGATMVPLGIAVGAAGAALIAARGPRWLGWLGVVGGSIAVANGFVIGTEMMAGLLTCLLWVLAAGARTLVKGRWTAAPGDNARRRVGDVQPVG